MTFREMTGMGIQTMLIQMVWEIKTASCPNFIVVFSAPWWIQMIAACLCFRDSKETSALLPACLKIINSYRIERMHRNWAGRIYSASVYVKNTAQESSDRLLERHRWPHPNFLSRGSQVDLYEIFIDGY